MAKREALKLSDGLTGPAGPLGDPPSPDPPGPQEPPEPNVKTRAWVSPPPFGDP